MDGDPRRLEHGLRSCSSTSSPSLSASPAPGVSVESAGSTSNRYHKGYGYAVVQDEPDSGMGGDGRADDATGLTPRPESGLEVEDVDFESPSVSDGLMLRKTVRGGENGAAVSIAGEGVDMSVTDDGRRVSSARGAGGVVRKRDVSGEGEGETDQCKQQLLYEKQRQEEGKAFWTSRDGFRHILVTAVFLGLSYAIAITLDDLGVILEVGVPWRGCDDTNPGISRFSVEWN